MDISIFIAAIGCVVALATFFVNRGAAGKKEAQDQANWRGKVTAILDHVAETLSTIQQQLASYQTEQSQMRREIAELRDELHQLKAKHEGMEKLMKSLHQEVN